jgi:lipopolysaccharide transport system permease protein
MSQIVTQIESGRSGVASEMAECWRYRELLGFLTWRDVTVRYRQTLLGAAWALVEPLVSAIVFTLLFHRMAGLESRGAPYPLACYSAMLVWTVFSRGVGGVAKSLTANAGLITKAWFPRLILPLATLLAVGVDFACAAAMYIVLLAWYGIAPGAALVTIPVWAALAALAALAVGLPLATINARFRDVSLAVPFLVQMWLFATPIAYPIDAVPGDWLWLYQLNPMVGVIEGAKWALLPEYAFHAASIFYSAVVLPAAALLGWCYFRASQRRLTDVV